MLIQLAVSLLHSAPVPHHVCTARRTVRCIGLSSCIHSVDDNNIIMQCYYLNWLDVIIATSDLDELCRLYVLLVTSTVLNGYSVESSGTHAVFFTALRQFCTFSACLSLCPPFTLCITTAEHGQTFHYPVAPSFYGCFSCQNI